jgi:hypothetical protein
MIVKKSPSFIRDSGQSEDELARILKRISAQEMWHLYLEWIGTHDKPGLITHVQLNNFCKSHGWTYLEMRNTMNPGLYGKRG